MGIGRLVEEARSGEDGRRSALANRLFFIGSMAVMAAVVAQLLRHFGQPAMLRAIDAGEHWVAVILRWTEVRQQMPPMPAHALYYCGIAIAVLGGLMRILEREPSRLGMRPIQVAAVIGRDSFVSYICIQWLIDFLPRWIGLDAFLRPGTAVLYLALVMVVVFMVAGVWDRHQANRFLTLGLSSTSAARGLLRLR
jgi:hypothetical protein